MALTVHPAVADDLANIATADPTAAAALRAELARIEADTRGGHRIDRAGWRVYTSVPGYAIVADGVGSGNVRILGVAPTPTLYDPDRLKAMATLAEDCPARRSERDKTVPSPAPRTRIVGLDDHGAGPSRGAGR